MPSPACELQGTERSLFLLPLPLSQAYRLLAEEMYTRGWDYPLHLGVTGRVRHAGVLLGVGMGLSSALGCDR